MKAWQLFLKNQEKILGAQTVKKWLSSLKIMRFDAGNLYLEAKDTFQAHWFEEHIRPKIATQLLSENNRPILVHLSVAALNETPEEKKPPKKNFIIHPLRLEGEKPNEQQKLENFIVTPDNEIVIKLLEQVVERKADPSFNPIFLYGPPGSGKTHLLNAVAFRLKKLGFKTLYVSANTFTEHVVEAIRSGQMQQFRQAYRHSDVLIIDDVQVFSNKASTQEEFFHTFNTLHVDGRPIILSGSHPPNELVGVEPRLVSRFEWGISLPLHPLKKAELRHLLERRAAELEIRLTEKTAIFLLETFFQSTKSLIKAIDAIALRLHINAKTGYTPSVEELRKLLADLIQKEMEALITPEIVIKTVAEHFGILVDDILGKSQSRECVLPRQIAMSLCRHQLDMPFTRIGSLFQRDHSTVMSAIKQAAKQQEENPDLSSAVNMLTKQLFYKGL